MRTIAPLIFVATALTACATPEVDRSQSAFDTARYQQDLNDCRGGHVLMATAEGLKVAVAGSLLGSMHGVIHGAAFNDSTDGAVVGAIAGAVLGFGFGASNALKERDASLEGCLREKGYMVIADNT